MDVNPFYINYGTPKNAGSNPPKRNSYKLLSKKHSGFNKGRIKNNGQEP